MNSIDWQSRDVRWYVVAGSLLFSALSFVFPDLPNDDAYVYFRTAEIFLSDGLQAAREHYSWPTYAVLLALISKTGASLFTSALLLNTLFFALLSWTFVSIVMQLTDSRNVILLSAVTVLLYPELNEFRTMVIRDTGFWALSLLAVYLLLVHLRRGDVASALGIVVALLLASTLRIEALVYLAVIPLVPAAQRLPVFARNNDEQKGAASSIFLLPALVYGCGLLAMLLLAAFGTNLFAVAGGFLASYAPFVESLFSNDPEQTARLNQQLIDSHGELIGRFSAAGPLVASLAVLVSTLVTGISGAYFWLLVYGAIKRYWPNNNSLPAGLLVWIVTNAIIVLGFLVLTGFLTSRYLILMALVLVLQVPFVVHRILEAAEKNSYQKKTKIFILLFFLFCFFDAYVSFGRSKAYLQDAADYVAVHNTSGESILTNNHSIAWASGLVGNYDAVSRVPTEEEVMGLQTGQYLAIELFAQTQELLARSTVSDAVEFVTAFPTEAEQRVAIYRRR
jgi:hypothetical protein